LGEDYNCMRLLDTLYQRLSERKKEGHLARTHKGEEVTELIFEEWPLSTALRTICVDDDKLPVIILDVPGLLEAFDSIGRGALRTFMARLLWILGKYRLVKLAATRGGMPYLELDLREMPRPESLDDAVGLVEAAQTAMRMIGSWMVLAYNLVRTSGEIPAVTIDDLIEKYGKTSRSPELLRI